MAVDQRLGLWLYGVIDADAAAAPERRGVDAVHDVELIRHAGLAALVSAVALDEYGESGLRAMLEDLDRLERLARSPSPPGARPSRRPASCCAPPT